MKKFEGFKRFEDGSFDPPCINFSNISLLTGSVQCCVVCLTDDTNDSCEVSSDSALGIYRAPYEKPTPLRCIEPLYQLNEDGSVPGEICLLFYMNT